MSAEAQNLSTPESADNNQKKIADTEAALQKYKDAIAKSRIPDADKKQCLAMLDTKPASQHDPKLLEANLKYLPEAERKAEEQRKTYEQALDKAISEGLFSKDPQVKKEYLKWLNSRPFDEREKIINQPLYKLDDRKKAAGEWERIPEAERKIHQAEWDKLGVEERLIKVTALKRRHETLKAEFLKLPAELQKKYKEQFKNKKLDDREALLSAIAKEVKPTKTSNKEIAEVKESTKLDKDFEVKTEKMVRDNLLAPDSKLKHDNWFKSLPLVRKRYMINNSDLDTRMKERKDTLKAFNKTPPEVRAKHDLRFRNADLDRRQAMLLELSGEDDQSKESSKKKEGFIRGMLKKLIFSRSHEDITKKVETFAVTDEIAERRKRFRLSHNTREESAAKADKKGLDTTAEESQKLAGATKREDMHEADGGIKVKLDVLESHADARHEWKRTLKPHMGDVNAKLASNITLRTKAGDEVIDERAYQRGELAREVSSIQDSMNPIIEEAARAAGLNIDETEISDVLKKEDWKEHGKEVIKRSA
jgi:hypothetical protein